MDWQGQLEDLIATMQRSDDAAPSDLPAQPSARSSWTTLTPGADHAARVAMPRSYHALTLPSSTTLSSITLTRIASAWSSAFRFRASRIFCLTSRGATFGLTSIRFETPTTPES